MKTNVIVRCICLDHKWSTSKTVPIENHGNEERVTFDRLQTGNLFRIVVIQKDPWRKNSAIFLTQVTSGGYIVFFGKDFVTMPFETHERTSIIVSIRSLPWYMDTE